MNRIRTYQSASGEWIATRDDGTKVRAETEEAAHAQFIEQHGDDPPIDRPERPARPTRPARARA